MKTKRIIWTAAIIIVVGVAIGYKLKQNKATMNANAEIANKKNTIFPVVVVNPELATLSQDIEVNGKFKPFQELDVVSEASGKIIAISHKNGDVIGKGAVIAKIDDEQLNIDLQLAQTNLAKSKLDLQNYRDMLKTNAVNKQEVLNAELTVTNNETRVATLQRQIRATRIISSVGGNINDMNVVVGSFVNVGTKIARIADLHQVTMVVRMQARDVLRVQRGQKVEIIPDVYSAEKLYGTVTSVGTIADGSRKYEVEITLPNSSKSILYAGMTGRATFRYSGQRSSIVIPSSSIVGSIQEPKVFVVENNVARLIPITIGKKQGEKLEVVDGLSTTQQVVTSGQVGLTSGVEVKIIH